MLLRLPPTCRAEDGGGSGAVVVVHEPCPGRRINSKILGLTDGTWTGRTNGEATRSVLGSGQWMDATKAEQDDLTGMSQWLRALRLRCSQASQARWREPWLSH
ncbi:Hypothetical predicted protein [Prunus dulcis]|uniref:Uncharacterized protein n=1 Tax=Prunus dulcis TaxID=3755 RepID=A0A5E4EU48_PRUDU|nr:Hypothetical predicted protein [Prunus dulcis]